MVEYKDPAEMEADLIEVRKLLRTSGLPNYYPDVMSLPAAVSALISRSSDLAKLDEVKHAKTMLFQYAMDVAQAVGMPGSAAGPVVLTEIQKLRTHYVTLKDECDSREKQLNDLAVVLRFTSSPGDVSLLEWAERIVACADNSAGEWRPGVPYDADEDHPRYSGGLIMEGRRVDVHEGDLVVIQTSGILSASALQRMQETFVERLGVNVCVLEGEPAGDFVPHPVHPAGITIRALPDDKEGCTCDWGCSANLPALYERWDNEDSHGWLPVCAWHAAHEGEPPIAALKEFPWHVCPECGSKNNVLKPQPPFFEEECVSHEHVWHYGPGGEIHKGPVNGSKDGKPPEVCCYQAVVIGKVKESAHV